MTAKIDTVNLYPNIPAVVVWRETKLEHCGGVSWELYWWVRAVMTRLWERGIFTRSTGLSPARWYSYNRVKGREEKTHEQ